MIDVIHKNISAGIDTHSSSTNIKEGYSSTILNMDTSSGGYITTRKGYEMHYGEIPLRIVSITHSGTSIRFTLHSSQVLDLSSVSPGPIIVHGRITDTSAAGDFTDNGDSLAYYSTWTLTNRDSVTTGSNTLTRSQAQHGYTTNYLWVGVANADGATGQSCTYTMPDTISIEKSSGDMSCTYLAPSSGEVFVYTTGYPAAAGQVHIESVVSSISATITAVTHQLDNFFIQVRCFEDDGTNQVEVIPNSVTIDGNGEVVVDFEETFTGVVVLKSTTFNFDGQAESGTSTITIPSPGSPFNYVDVYYLTGTTFTRVIPNKVSYDEATDSLIVEYFLVSGAESVSIYYSSATIDNNVLTVTDSSGTSEAYVDAQPQLTLWGISHSNIYKNSTARGGHVSHLDGYKRPGESRVIAGLGGNIYKELSRSEATATFSDSDPFMPSYVVSINERTNGAVIIAPLFTASANSRTAGEVVDTSIVDNKALVTGVEYVDSSSTKYTLTFDSAQTLTGKYTANDKFTVSNLSFSQLNGTFNVTGIENDGTTSVTLTLNNTNGNPRYDGTTFAGKIICTTDSVTMQTTPDFVAGDLVNYASSGAAQGLTVSAVSGTTLVLDGVESPYDLADGLKFSITRTTATIPLANLSGTAIVENIVGHDKVEIEGYSRTFKVKSIDTTNKTITIDEAISITEGDTVSVEGRWFPVEIPASTSALPKATYIQHFTSNAYDRQESIRSTIINDTMFFTNSDDEVMKFDGTNISRAGLPRWQPMCFSTLDTSITSISPSFVSSAVSAVVGKKFTVTNALTYSPGDRVTHSADNAIYTVSSIYPDTNEVYVTSTISGGGTGSLTKLVKLQYYFRISLLDENNNIVKSAITSHNDAIIEIGQACAVRWRLLGLPAFLKYDHDRIEVEMFRALQGTKDFRLVGRYQYPLGTDDPYIEFVDTTDEEELTFGRGDIVLEDEQNNELSTAVQGPIRAGFVSSVNNRLILGDLKSYPQFDVTFQKVASAGTFTTAQVDGTDLLFGATYTIGATDYTDSYKYKLMDATSASIFSTSAFTNNGGQTQFTVTGASPVAGLTWVYLYHSTVGNNKDLTYSGWFKVQSVSGDNITINATYDAGAALPDKCIVVGAANEIPVWLGTDGNFGHLEGNNLRPDSLAAFRLSLAINSTMRQVAPPLLTASSGNDYASGQIFIEQPYAGVDGATCTITHPNSASLNIFINGVLRTNSEVVGSDVLLYPSRIIQSNENYPEIFDNPLGDNETSLAVSDINAQDGQEVVMGIPFFGSSTFGGGQLNDVFVVFKTNSVYVYNTTGKEYQKLDSRGLGCTAPKSVASTQNGIMFANASGIYRLNRDMSISYVGQMAEGIWRDQLNDSAVNEIVGHQYRNERKFKLSLPLNSDLYSNDALVYDYDSEGNGGQYGAWTQYDSHPATMWCNLDESAFFGSFAGQVYKIRDNGDASDYRDDEAAISVEWVYRPEDFGAPNRRKLIHKGFIECALDHTNLTGVELFTRMKLNASFSASGNITESISDSEDITVRFSLPNRKGIYAQVKVTHAVKDENLTITGLHWAVDGLETTGVPEAADY